MPGGWVGRTSNTSSATRAGSGGDLWPAMAHIAEEAATTIRNGRRVFIELIGHIFPTQVPAAERDDLLVVLGPRWRKLPTQRLFDRQGTRGDLLIVLGMPTFPAAHVQAGLDKGMSVIATSTDQPPKHLVSERLHWIRMPWPRGDGAVRLPGYDVQILPVTGVVNALVYYAVKAEVRARLNEGPASAPAR